MKGFTFGRHPALTLFPLSVTPEGCNPESSHRISGSNQQGFTLIELLVVVLIIGILSSVALPQYQKAVLRSRAAEAWPNLKTLNMAANAYCLENPSGSFYGNDAAELSSALAVEVKESKNLRYWGEVNCNNSLHPIVFGARLQPNALDLWLNAKTGRRSCSGSGCEKIGFALSTSDSNICIRGANCGVSTCYAEGSGCGSSCGSSSCGSSCGA
ncbi:MAG: prepilin-type N-terminal cleavage/methylation domain-containing protein [Elusimicrobia bacterium]|nr:prepilin-type N-terminal cleavage/methylation domain-containing protein [Elusimicrobiota bacterium]